MVMPAPQVAAMMPVPPMAQAPIGAAQVQQDMAMQQEVAIMGQMMGQMATVQIGAMAQMSAMVQPQMAQQAMEQGQTAAKVPPQMAALPVATAEAHPPMMMPAQTPTMALPEARVPTTDAKALDSKIASSPIWTTPARSAHTPATAAQA